MVEQFSAEIDWSVVSVAKTDDQRSVDQEWWYSFLKKIVLNTSAKQFNRCFHKVSNNIWQIKVINPYIFITFCIAVFAYLLQEVWICEN